jgi:hypothetical protein
MNNTMSRINLDFGIQAGETSQTLVGEVSGVVDDVLVL